MRTTPSQAVLWFMTACLVLIFMTPTDAQEEVLMWAKWREQMQKHMEKMGANVAWDIAYVQSSDAQDEQHKQSLDVYSAHSDQLQPVMMYVHGGGWKRGDKRAVGAKAEYFVSQGWVFVSVNYRLLPDGEFPNNAQDVANAVVWVQQGIEAYGGDPQQIYLMGHSAGAHLVAVVGTNEQLLKNAGSDLSAIQAVIEIDTNVLDLPRLIERDGGVLYQKIFGDDPAIWQSVSPITYLKKDTQYPAFLLIVAGNNPSKLDQAEHFGQTLEAVDADVWILEADDQTHSSVNRQIGQPDHYVTQQIMAFIDLVRTPKAQGETQTSTSDIQEKSSLDKSELQEEDQSSNPSEVSTTSAATTQ